MPSVDREPSPRLSLAAKHVAMVTLTFLSGACGSWIVSEVYTPKTGLILPIAAILAVLIGQLYLTFRFLSTEEMELADRAEANRIRQAGKKELASILKEQAVDRLRRGELHAVQDYNNLMKEL